MKTFKAMLVDDEPDAISYLEDLLQDFPEIEVCARIADPNLAINAVIDFLPDIIFLDIQMPGKDGFEALKEIRMLNKPFYIVFTTAFDKYAIEAVKQAAFDYLLKPVDPEELATTITRLKANTLQKDYESRIENLLQNLDKNKKLRFNTRTGFIILNSEDIIYIESDRNYSTIFLKGNRKEVITMNLGTIETLLPGHFRRISRFHIINTEFIAQVDRKKRLCILTVDGVNHELPVNSKNIRGLEEVAR